MNNFVAALAAAANKPASAGVLGYEQTVPLPTAETKVISSNFCVNNHSVESDGADSTILNDKISHQIGTNLTDLSVCWHKIDESKKDENLESSLFDDDSHSIDSNDQTRKSFQEEFSSLILKSDGLKSLIVLDNSDTHGQQIGFNLDCSVSSKFEDLTKKDLIEQIDLFNKYSSSKFSQLSYQVSQNENEPSLSVNGMVKIHWNLKNPLKLCQEATSEQTDSTTSTIAPHNDFKATSLRDLNVKKKQQSSWDDSSCDLSSSSKSSESSLFKFQTVKCKANRWKRPPIEDQTIDTTKQIDEAQMFVPSYASVSSICIDNSVTCQKAISILFDKYHILNPPNDFSLYKAYQSGYIQELDDNAKPLIERIWMGPFFNEDKLFIMEKGRKVGVKQQEAALMICLPRDFLLSLVDKAKQEESKEVAQLKANFKKYHDALSNFLKT